MQTWLPIVCDARGLGSTQQVAQPSYQNWIPIRFLFKNRDIEKKKKKIYSNYTSN